MTDCQYYKSRKSDWGYSGGADATQWCSHPESTGSLKCDTDKCPKAIEELENDSCEHPGRRGCGVCGACQTYADVSFDLMKEGF